MLRILFFFCAYRRARCVMQHALAVCTTAAVYITNHYPVHLSADGCVCCERVAVRMRLRQFWSIIMQRVVPIHVPSNMLRVWCYTQRPRNIVANARLHTYNRRHHMDSADYGDYRSSTGDNNLSPFKRHQKITILKNSSKDTFLVIRSHRIYIFPFAKSTVLRLTAAKQPKRNHTQHSYIFQASFPHIPIRCRCSTLRMLLFVCV